MVENPDGIGGWLLFVPGWEVRTLTPSSHLGRRPVFHTATFYYLDDSRGERFGNRAVGWGGKPYPDPNNSTSRIMALSSD